MKFVKKVLSIVLSFTFIFSVFYIQTSAKIVSYGKKEKRETTDIYEIIKKVPRKFREQRLSEWLDTREKQDAKLQKITDTARRLSQLIPSHKK